VAGLEEMSREQLIGLVIAQAGQIAALTESNEQLRAANAQLGVRLARLEHLLSRNSGNSSMPPSRDDDPGRSAPAPKPRPGRGPTRSRGKQPGAPGSHLAWVDDPAERVDRFPCGRCGCGRDLADAADLGIVDRYQQHEIPLVSVAITQYDQHEVVCRGCGATHVAARPEGARSGPVGYGPNLAAFAVYLLVVQHIPVERCVRLLESLTGAKPSVGFVHSLIERAARLLVEVDKRIRTLITLARVVCCDETPLRVGSKTPRPGRKKAEKYLLVACTELYTHYLLGDRDLDTFTKFVFADLAANGSIVVHDRYHLYDSGKIGEPTHQLCCAHLLRDLDAAAQTYPDAEWPPQVARALRGLIHATNLARQTGRTAIDTALRDTLIGEFESGVRVGLSETTRHGNRPGERTTRLLLEMLRDRQPDVLRFTTDPRIPATNNLAERDLRPAKTQQKISGRLTNEAATKDRYRIRGYLSTAAKHGHNVMAAMREAILGHPWIPPDPAPA
jgi:transposase